MKLSISITVEKSIISINDVVKSSKLSCFDVFRPSSHMGSRVEELTYFPADTYHEDSDPTKLTMHIRKTVGNLMLNLAVRASKNAETPFLRLKVRPKVN